MKIKLLKEKTRYERETGEKYSPKEDFASRITEQPCEYAFTMTDVAKVGLNPKTNFKTPAGVYFYPLDQDHCEMLLENQLPFASDRKYCGLVKLNWSNKKKWLIFGSNQDNQDAPAYKRVEDYIKNKMSRSEFDVLKYRVDTHGKNQNGKNGIDGLIFDLTYFASLTYKINQGSKATIAWAKLLRELGYIGLYDYGSGVIHPSEQTQLVCLEPSAYQTFRVYETKDIRRGSADEKENIAYKKKQAELVVNKIKFWKDFFALPVEQRIYESEHMLDIGDLLELGFPLSKLDGATFNCPVRFEFYGDKQQQRLPHNFTSNSGIVVVGVKEMGRNLTCKFLILKEGIKEIPEGYNLKAGKLSIYQTSELQTIPNDLELGGLEIFGNNFTHLPDNLVIGGNLAIWENSIKSLPKGLIVDGDLYIPNMFKDASPEEFLQNFPEDLEVFKTITGNFPFGYVEDRKRDDFMRQVKNYRKAIQAQKNVNESYNRWKKLI